MKKKGNNLTHFDLGSINDPSFLSSLGEEELKILASNIREEIIKVTSVNGGHLSSNLGAVELTIALHRYFDFKKDKLIFDVGHQAYTHKILTGRNLKTLRKKGGVAGFIKLSESPYDVYEAGHSSTSLSAAAAFAYARKINKDDYQIVVFIGDASINNGLAFEALNHISTMNEKIIIILNDNEMSISLPVGGFKKSLFEEINIAHIGPVDGHNFKSIEDALKESEKIKDRPVLIHCVTKKGKGYIPSEEDTSGAWHGVVPFDIKTGKPINDDKNYISWSKAYSLLLDEKMEKDSKVILISPSTKNGAELDYLFEKYPNRTIDVGIAEEHSITFAGALALNHLKPIVSIYSTFLQRGYDNVFHDVARMHLPVTFLVERAGLIGNDGDTHQGIYDVGFLTSIPNTYIAMPSTYGEAKEVINIPPLDGPLFIRLPKDKISTKEIEKNEPIALSKNPLNWRHFYDSNSKSKIAFLSYGPLGREVARRIKDKRLDIELINTLFLSPLDQSILKSLIKNELIYIYNPYSIKEGYTDKIMGALLDLGYKGKIIHHDVSTCFIEHASIEEQLEMCGLDINTITNEIFSLFEK